MSSDKPAAVRPTCCLCGETMPEGEEMFNYHGYSGPCPKLPLPSKPTQIEMPKRIAESQLPEPAAPPAAGERERDIVERWHSMQVVDVDDITFVLDSAVALRAQLAAAQKRIKELEAERG